MPSNFCNLLPARHLHASLAHTLSCEGPNCVPHHLWGSLAHASHVWMGWRRGTIQGARQEGVDTFVCQQAAAMPAASLPSTAVGSGAVVSCLILWLEDAGLSMGALLAWPGDAEPSLPAGPCHASCWHPAGLCHLVRPPLLCPHTPVKCACDRFSVRRCYCVPACYAWCFFFLGAPALATYGRGCC